MINYEVHQKGMQKVIDELENRGFTSVNITGTRRKFIEAYVKNSNRVVQIIVKVKRTGSWQTSCQEGKRTDAPLINNGKFWIFIALEDEPKYWVVYDAWIRDNISREHERYLKEHGGHRPVTEGSDHHSIEEHRLKLWQEKWDILG